MSHLFVSSIRELKYDLNSKFSLFAAPSKLPFLIISVKVFICGFVALFVKFVLAVRNIPHNFRKYNTSNGQGQLVNQIRNIGPANVPNLAHQYALSSALYVDASPALQKRLDRLEEKVTLLTKAQEVNAPKEALMDISIQRIKSLEAEVVETRKVSFWLEFRISIALSLVNNFTTTKILVTCTEHCHCFLCFNLDSSACA
jgi:hypothetical protein